MSDCDVLTLTAVASRVAAKKRALEIVDTHEAVTCIVDRLHLAPASGMRDAEFKSPLRDFFGPEPAFGGYAIKHLQCEIFMPGYRPVYETIAADPATARGEIDNEVRDGFGRNRRGANGFAGEHGPRRNRRKT